MLTSAQIDENITVIKRLLSRINIRRQTFEADTNWTSKTNTKRIFGAFTVTKKVIPQPHGKKRSKNKTLQFQ
jgi:hypothetical protein